MVIVWLQHCPGLKTHGFCSFQSYFGLHTSKSLDPSWSETQLVRHPLCRWCCRPTACVADPAIVLPTRVAMSAIHLCRRPVIPLCSDSDSLFTKFNNKGRVLQSGKHINISIWQHWHTATNIVKGIQIVTPLCRRFSCVTGPLCRWPSESSSHRLCRRSNYVWPGGPLCRRPAESSTHYVGDRVRFRFFIHQV